MAESWCNIWRNIFGVLIGVLLSASVQRKRRERVHRTGDVEELRIGVHVRGQAWVTVPHRRLCSTERNAALAEVGPKRVAHFGAADAIRDELEARGIVLEDGPDETRWKVVG